MGDIDGDGIPDLQLEHTSLMVIIVGSENSFYDTDGSVSSVQRHISDNGELDH